MKTMNKIRYWVTKGQLDYLKSPLSTEKERKRIIEDVLHNQRL